MKFVTPQQLEVWRRVAAGQHTKEISSAMGVCRQTIDKHRGDLMRTLGVRGQVELTLRAVEFGVIEVARRPLVPSRNGRRLRWGIPS